MYLIRTHLKTQQSVEQAVKVTRETPAITPMAILHTIADLLPLPIFKKKTSCLEVE